METYLLYFLIWISLMATLLRFTPNAKIDHMGDFFKKVIPTIPVSKIFSIIFQWKEEKSKE